MPIEVAQLQVEIGADVSGLDRGMAQAETRLVRFARTTGEQAKSSQAASSDAWNAMSRDASRAAGRVQASLAGGFTGAARASGDSATRWGRSLTDAAARGETALKSLASTSRVVFSGMTADAAKLLAENEALAQSQARALVAATHKATGATNAAEARQVYQQLGPAPGVPHVASQAAYEAATKTIQAAPQRAETLYQHGAVSLPDYRAALVEQQAAHEAFSEEWTAATNRIARLDKEAAAQQQADARALAAAQKEAARAYDASVAQEESAQEAARARGASAAAKYLAQQEAAASASQARMKALTGAISGAGNFAATGAAGITLLSGAAAKLATDLDYSLTTIRNNTTMTDGDMKAMKATVLSLGKESGASFDDLAKGFMHVSNFGFTAAQSTDILREAMKSAVATGTDAASTADILGKTLHEFNLPAAEAGRAMNVLHLSAAQGNTTLEQFDAAAGKAFATAAALHVPLTDVSAAMSALTRHGFDAAEAATQVQNVMVHIINPAKDAQKNIQALSQITGVDLARDFSAAGLKAKGLSGVLADVQKAVGGNTDLVTKLIPAMRGGQGAMVLAGAAARDYGDILANNTDAMNGKTDPVAKAYNDTLNTQHQRWARLVDKVQADFLPAGEKVTALFERAEPILLKFADALTKILDVFTRLPAPVQEAVLGLGALKIASFGLMNPLAGVGGVLSRIIGLLGKKFVAGSVGDALAGGGLAAGAGGFLSKAQGLLSGLPARIAAGAAALPGAMGLAEGGLAAGAGYSGVGGLGAGALGAGAIGGSILALPALVAGGGALAITGQMNKGYDAQDRLNALPDFAPLVNKMAALRGELSHLSVGTDAYTRTLHQLNKTEAAYRHISGADAHGASATLDTSAPGLAIARAAYEKQMSGDYAGYVHHCEELARKTVQTSTHAFDGVFSGAGSALEALHRFQKAGLARAYTPGQALPPGSLLYSATMGHGSGHVQTIGPRGERFDQYGANHFAPQNFQYFVPPPGVSVPGSAAAASASSTASAAMAGHGKITAKMLADMTAADSAREKAQKRLAAAIASTNENLGKQIAIQKAQAVMGADGDKRATHVAQINYEMKQGDLKGADPAQAKHLRAAAQQLDNLEIAQKSKKDAQDLAGAYKVSAAGLLRDIAKLNAVPIMVGKKVLDDSRYAALAFDLYHTEGKKAGADLVDLSEGQKRHLLGLARTADALKAVKSVTDGYRERLVALTRDQNLHAGATEIQAFKYDAVRTTADLSVLSLKGVTSAVRQQIAAKIALSQQQSRTILGMMQEQALAKTLVLLQEKLALLSLPRPQRAVVEAAGGAKQYDDLDAQGKASLGSAVHFTNVAAGLDQLHFDTLNRLRDSMTPLATETDKATAAIANLLANDPIAAKTPNLKNWIDGITGAARALDEESARRGASAQSIPLLNDIGDLKAKLAGTYDPAKQAGVEWVRQNQEWIAQLDQIWGSDKTGQFVQNMQSQMQDRFHLGVQVQNLEKYNAALADLQKQALQMRAANPFEAWKASLLELDPATQKLKMPYTDAQAKNLYDIQQKMALAHQAAQGITDVLSGAFTAAYEHGFKGFFTNVLDGFKQMLLRMATEYLQSQLLQALNRKLSGVFGGSSGDGSVGGLLGGLLGGKNKASDSHGGAAGTAFGASAGSALGSVLGGFIPGLGGVIGSVIGGTVSNVLGGAISSSSPLHGHAIAAAASPLPAPVILPAPVMAFALTPEAPRLAANPTAVGRAIASVPAPVSRAIVSAQAPSVGAQAAAARAVAGAAAPMLGAAIAGAAPVLGAAVKANMQSAVPDLTGALGKVAAMSFVTVARMDKAAQGFSAGATALADARAVVDAVPSLTPRAMSAFTPPVAPAMIPALAPPATPALVDFKPTMPDFARSTAPPNQAAGQAYLTGEAARPADFSSSQLDRTTAESSRDLAGAPSSAAPSSAAAPAQGDTHYHFQYNINTPNPEAFRRSQAVLLAEAHANAKRAALRNG